MIYRAIASARRLEAAGSGQRSGKACRKDCVGDLKSIPVLHSQLRQSFLSVSTIASMPETNAAALADGALAFNRVLRARVDPFARRVTRDGDRDLGALGMREVFQ